MRWNPDPTTNPGQRRDTDGSHHVSHLKGSLRLKFEAAVAVADAGRVGGEAVAGGDLVVAMVANPVSAAPRVARPDVGGRFDATGGGGRVRRGRSRGKAHRW